VVHVIAGERGEVLARAFRVEPVAAWRLGEVEREEPCSSLELLQRVVDQLPVGVWITDESGQIVVGNPAGRRIWGGARFVGPERYGEYEGWWLDSGERIAPEEWAAARAVRRGETSIGELVQIRAFDGTLKTIINSAVPLTDEAGNVTGAIVVNEDVTHLRETEEELQQAVAAREEILGIVSHDLRNPLNRIVLHCLVALAELAGSELDTVRQHLEKIVRAARTMDRLIGDLVDLVHIEQGQLSIDAAPVSAAALVSDAVEMSRVQAKAASLELVASLPDDLPSVLADRVRVRQVFSNLIGNAIKFTPSGGRIEVAAQPLDTEVVFSVSDTGPGIPETMLDRLFDHFWRGPGRREGGLGLGLAIAKGIVTTHGGRIWAESHPGAGSTFFFVLPTASGGGSGVRRRQA
jgi:signal transduction histidine kinase